MISEKDKQAIFNGDYGVSRKGFKCKFIGVHNNSNFPYAFVYYNNDGTINCIHNVTKQFTHTACNKSEFDILGLWQNIEPFDLERALAGEPVMLRNGSKAVILKQIKDTLIGYFDECTPFGWELNGDADRAAESNHDIVSMWKEPKQDTVTVNLPCPLKEPKDGMWSVNECGPIESFYRGKDMNLSIFNKRVYFSSKEDAQAWFDAMKYNRR